MQPTVGFVTLGCAKNLVDAQVMAGVLLAEGLRLAPSPEEADVVVVNTCAFIAAARAEAAEAIRRACRHKAAGGCRAVIVSGCLPQRGRERLAAEFPDVDAFVGVDGLERIAAVARQVLAGQRGLVHVPAGPPRRLFRPRLPALRFSGGPFAYLKIAEGCNHACAFCAIPGIRGRFRSRGTGELVAEARRLLDTGCRELDLIAQDTTAYGDDRRDGACLPGLLRRLDALEGDFWIRLLYGYPSRVTDELLAALAGSRHALPYLDVPVQHSHPDVLRAMQRAETRRAVIEGPARWRRAVPGLVLRTTCLVGFPGETEAHFRHLLEYAAATRFDHLGVFAYSPEEGTAAFGRPAPPPEVAAERRDRLLALQRGIVAARRRELRGREDTALLLGPASGVRTPDPGPRPLWLARLPRQAPDVDGLTRVAGVPPGAKPGDFLPIRLTGGHGYDLRAAATPRRPLPRS
jgi:ribosomal protein S12 methylthiotransferase